MAAPKRTLSIDSLTTTERNALSGLGDTSLIYNSTTQRLEYTGNSGASWSDISLLADIASITPASIGAPTINGTGAAGTWGIGITGNAATATNANNATTAGSAGTADSATTAGYATNAGNSETSDYATNAGNATSADAAAVVAGTANGSSVLFADGATGDQALKSSADFKFDATAKILHVLGRIYANASGGAPNVPTFATPDDTTTGFDIPGAGTARMVAGGLEKIKVSSSLTTINGLTKLTYPDASTYLFCNASNEVAGISENIVRALPGYVNGFLIKPGTTVKKVTIEPGNATDTTNYRLIKSSVDLSADITVSGVNGLDTGSPVDAEWYAVHVISNFAGTSTAALLSASATAPTMPVGYDIFRRVGWIRYLDTNIYPNFYCAGSGNTREYFALSNNYITVLVGGTATTFTQIDLSGVMAPGTNTGTITYQVTGNNLYGSIRAFGTSTPSNNTAILYGPSGTNSLRAELKFYVHDDQIIEYQMSATPGSVTMRVTSFIDYL